MRACIASALMAGALAAHPVVAAAAPALSGDDLLRKLSDPVVAAAPLRPDARMVQRSSHEREGGNRDWGVWSDEERRPPTYVRREEGGYVLLDERRPGCLVRMWFTAGPVAVTDIASIGRLQLFFDGEDEPSVDVPAAEFFAGEIPGFPQPLVGNADSSSGGHYSYVPFCFRRSLKVRVTAIPEDGSLWYQLSELVLPHGASVETYREGVLDTAAAAQALGSAGPPAGGDPAVAETSLVPGDTLPVVERSGAGSLRSLAFSVAPFTAETLAGLELRVTADRAREPQIVVPLGSLFGDGLAVRAIRTPAFGMDPVAGTGYLSLPMPYSRGIKVELGAETLANVRAEVRSGAPLPETGPLHGRRVVEHSRPGFDFTALDAPGSGRLASWVLDLIGPPGSDKGPLQYFLEGDERVHLDGSPSPAIYGTGTEDAFNGGFYYSRGPVALPTHGAGIFLSRPETRGARSQYRVFGADGYSWERGIRFGMEHGGGDELADEITASTVLWYEGTTGLRRTDLVLPGKRRSRRAHRFRGRFKRQRLTAYFEGERDGNATESSYPLFGGQEYLAPAAEDSPEGVTSRGIAFRRPVSLELALRRAPCGAIIRRRVDALTRSRVKVSVDGRRVGPWVIAEANSAKRWLTDDFFLTARHTTGKRKVRVKLSPARGTTATIFRVEALRRTGCGDG